MRIILILSSIIFGLSSCDSFITDIDTYKYLITKYVDDKKVEEKYFNEANKLVKLIEFDSTETLQKKHIIIYDQKQRIIKKYRFWNGDKFSGRETRKYKDGKLAEIVKYNSVNNGLKHKYFYNENDSIYEKVYYDEDEDLVIGRNKYSYGKNGKLKSIEHTEYEFEYDSREPSDIIKSDIEIFEYYPDDKISYYKKYAPEIEEQHGVQKWYNKQGKLKEYKEFVVGKNPVHESYEYDNNGNESKIIDHKTNKTLIVRIETTSK